MKKTGRLRLWAFRLIAVFVVPTLIFGLAELGLRIFGCGYRPAAMSRYDVDGRRLVGENPRFPWRFFPPAIAREFDPFLFAAAKPAMTYRIFILGGSAAQGVPDGAFAFGRILAVMLREAFPRVRFEVINTGLTAVNSHVVLPLARECLRHQPDLLIVYMGNNEVVGPFGPSAIWNPFSSSLALIRFNVALKTLRLGQLSSRLAEAVASPKDNPPVWLGMEMFLQSRVTADDPRLRAVYRHFKANLEDIRQSAEKNGAAAIFCTPGLNLRDCPPFASLHRRDLAPERLKEWDDLYRRGIEQEAAGRDLEARQSYQSASEIDGDFADLHFRLAGCCRRLGDYAGARAAFLKAGELDALRFRSDAEIRGLIRETAAGREDRRVYLFDAAEALAAETAPDVPGEDLFYDHVHMNFHAGYIIARGLFDRIRTLLPDEMKAGGPAAAGEASEDTCAEKLAYSAWDRYRIAEEMLESYIKNPPFTNQLGHGERVSRLERALFDLKSRITPDTLRESEDLYQRAVAAFPEDWWLRWKYAHLLVWGMSRDRDALASFEAVVKAVRHSARGYAGLGFIRLQLGDVDGAIESCLRGLAIDPAKADLENTLGAAYVSKGLTDKAEARFKKALRLNPQYEQAYLNLADLYAKNRRLEEAADLCRRGLKSKPRSPDLVLALADYLSRMGLPDDAVTALKEAQRLDPANEAVNRKLNEILWEKIKKN